MPDPPQFVVPETIAQFDAWADAIEAACLEVGFEMEVDPLDPDTYQWTCVHDDDAHPFFETATGHSACFDAFHRAAVLAERLRPAWLRPSPTLREMLDG